jgi:hypothetical protein
MPTQLEVYEEMVKIMEDKGLGGPLLTGLKLHRDGLLRSQPTKPQEQRLSGGLVIDSSMSTQAGEPTSTDPVE